MDSLIDSATKLDNLFRKVNNIVIEDRLRRNEKYMRGESFNIFEVLNLETNETRTHSAFLAELLKPKGSHGAGDRFLCAFLKSIDCLKDWEFNTADAQVYTEYHAGFTNIDKTNGGRIDILIESHEKYIIIENKIYAGDQENQLLRYHNFAGSHEHRILYLTLDRQEASDYSTRTELKAEKDYFPIGYNTEIIQWLNSCIAEASRYPLIRETVIQYLNLVKKITNQDMDTKSREQLLDAMISPDNIDAVTAIINESYDWQNRILDKYLIEPLKEFAESKELQMITANNIHFKVKETGFKFRKKTWTEGCTINIWSETSGWRDFFTGIELFRGNNNNITLFKNAPTEYYPFGWERLEKYKTWDTNAMPDMVRGKIAEFIIQTIENILQKIDDNHILLQKE